MPRVIYSLLLAIALATAPNSFARTDDGSVLPFPPMPSASVAQPRLQDSTMKWGTPKQRFPADAPNVLIILIDDVAF